jgi:tetratricopeptide (TPR) repeat protein
MGEQDELPASVHDKLKGLCAEGDSLAAAGRFDDAVSQYNAAWALVPDPKNHWNASTWILAAIADACFLGGYETSALEALQYAMTCPGAVGNPFLHLRLGQVLLDKDQPDEAANELARAYMGAGEQIFEDQDERYLAFLKTRMKI